jgi:hypothetical protein
MILVKSPSLPMLVEYRHPSVHRVYEYQPRPLMCWAAAALTLWRSRYGCEGRGASVDALLQAPRGSGDRYARILEFAAALAVEMRGSRDLGEIPAAEVTVRAARPEFEEVPSGLPDKLAHDFFTQVLGCRATKLDGSTSREAMKALIRQSAPLAIFTRQPSHIVLIVGYREVREHDPQSPHLLMFDPEAYLIATDDGADESEATLRALRDENVSWTQWQAGYVNNLVDSRCWHY